MTLTTVTTYGRSAGSARVRVFDWIDHLRIESAHLTYVGGATNSPRLLARRPLHVIRAEARLRKLEREAANQSVLVSRQATPFSRGAVESAILGAAQRGVYDFDDALYLTRRGSAFNKAEIWRKSVAAADVVIAGNAILAEAASKYSRNVTVIPSCVAPSHYQRKSSYEVEEIPRAVWIGSPSTEKFLQTIAGALIRANERYGLRLTLVSSGNSPLGRIEPIVDRVTWSLESFSDVLAWCDFGIMPLVDDPWSRGKCAYKLLQYGAAGLPLIGSPVGANREVLELSAGFAPKGDDEWYDALVEVIGEAEPSRRARGMAALRTVGERYSFDAWEGAWRTAVGIEP